MKLIEIKTFGPISQKGITLWAILANITLMEYDDQHRVGIYGVWYNISKEQFEKIKKEMSYV